MGLLFKKMGKKRQNTVLVVLKTWTVSLDDRKTFFKFSSVSTK